MQTMTLEQMKNIDIRTVNPDDLVDLHDVITNPDKPRDERMKDYIRQIKNPYCYTIGKVAVKVSYSENGGTLEDRLESLLMKL